MNIPIEIINFEKKIMSRAQLIEYKKTLKLTDLQRECIIGTLLGDATIMKPRKDYYFPNIKWEQAIKNQEYVNHLYQIMEPWVGTPPSIRNITGGGARDRQSIWFKTYQHPSFSHYNNQFYMEDPNLQGRRRKCIPELLHRWLTPRVLAYWFMDDGTLSSTGYMLNTQCYPMYEQKRAAYALGRVFDLEISIVKDRVNSLTKEPSYRLYINKASRDRFREIVAPYIVPCMAYKLHKVQS
jgi:hypothetical protein